VKLILILMAFGLSVSFAQTKKPVLTEEPPVPHQQQSEDPYLTPAPIQEPVAIDPEPENLPTKVLRGLTRYNGSIHFSPLSTWLPGKLGLSLGYILDQNWTIEAESTSKSYSASFKSVDFGKIVDRRYGIQSRWYPNSNSFNLIMGLFKSEFSAEIGNTIINNMSTIPSQTVFKFQSLGPQLGLANRWQWKSGVNFGVDWLVMYVPLFNKQVDDEVLHYITNTTDRSDLDTVIGVVSKLPQFEVLRLTLGYSF